MRKRRQSYVDGGPIDPFYPFPTTPKKQKKYNYEEFSGVYDGPLLPSATVTGKKPTFLREWGDLINEESKGAGLGEALFMTPLNAVLSLPQLAATKLASGKAQRPSKALDIKNPVGQVAVDALLDPLNLVGVGAASKIAGLKNTKPILGPVVKAVAKDAATRLNPLNLKTLSAEKWINDWYNDPTLVSKINNRYPEFASVPNLQRELSEDFQKTIVDNLKQYEPKNYIDLYIDKGYPAYSKHSKTSSGVSYGDPKSIYVNRSSTFPFNRKGLESTRVHELSHLADKNGKFLRVASDEKALLKPFGFDDPLDHAYKKVTGQLGRLEDYYTDPTEIRARLNQARFKLNLKPSDEFTPEMFDKIANEDDWFGMGKYIKDKKSFVDMANKMWAAPVTVATGAMLKNQESQTEIRGHKDGGYLQNNQMRKRKNYINGGFTGDPYQLAIQQALEASRGFNGLATDNTDIQQMAGGIAPLQLNGQSKIPTAPHEVPGMLSGLENVKMGDPASMAIQAVIGKATATAGDFVDAYKYKATLGPEKKRSDYNMDLMKGFASAGLFGMVPTMVRRRKDQNTMVAGSPGTYAMGGQMGDQQLSSGAFQVKDDPNVTDGKHYPEYDANLDHNEVVDKNAKFVFSDELKNGKQTFAKEAAGLYKKIAAVENRKDPISQATAQQLTKQIQTLAMTQEQLAEALGLRNNKPQGMATGGFAEGPDDPIDPKKLISLGKNYFLKEDGDTGRELLYYQKNGRYFRLSPNEKRDFENSDYYLTTVLPKLNSIYQAMNDNVKVGHPIPINDGAGNAKPSILAYPFSTSATTGTTPIANPSSPTSATIPIAPTTQQPTTGSGKPKTANTKGLPWEDFNVDHFQQWYNSMPGGNKIPNDKQWGPATKKAYEEAAFDYMNLTGKNYVDSVGGMSVISPDGTQFSSVAPVNGKLLPSSIGEFQKIPKAGVYIDTPEGPVDISELDGSTPTPKPAETIQERLARTVDPTTGKVHKQGADPLINPAAPVMDMTATPKDNLSRFRQRQTLGDALQGVDVASKFFGLLRGPEVEPQILDTTPITKTTFDPMAAMYQNQRNFQNTANSLGTSSANTRRAVINSMYANKLNADNQVMADYQNRNQQANTQYEQALSQRRQRNISSQFNTNNLNAANRGQYDNTVQNAFTSLGNFGEVLNRKQMSQDVLELLQLNYPKVYEGVMSDWEDIKGTKKKKTTKTTETTIQ